MTVSFPDILQASTVNVMFLSKTSDDTSTNRADFVWTYLGIPEEGRQIHDMQRDRRQRPARRCVDEGNKQNEDLQRGKDGKRPAGGRIPERKRIQKGRTQMNLRHSPQTRPVRNFGKDMKQDGPGRTCDPGRWKSSVWGFRRLWSHGC